MKLGIILQSNKPEHIWNTLRLAIASLKAQHSVLGIVKKLSRSQCGYFFCCDAAVMRNTIIEKLITFDRFGIIKAP